MREGLIVAQDGREELQAHLSKGSHAASSKELQQVLRGVAMGVATFVATGVAVGVVLRVAIV